LSRDTIRRKRREKETSLSSSASERTCGECSYFYEDKLECGRLLRSRKRDDIACEHISAISRVAEPFTEITAIGDGKRLNSFCADFRALAEKKFGYKVAVQTKKNCVIVKVYNADDSFGPHLLELAEKWSKKLFIKQINQKTQVKIKKHKL
jgi:hypothetical protein